MAQAREIRLAGDFNYWSGQDHQMRKVGSGGVWELFVPDVGDGTRYKFLVHGADGLVGSRAERAQQAATQWVVFVDLAQLDDRRARLDQTLILCHVRASWA